MMATVLKMKDIQSELEKYKSKCGRYPTTAEGLGARLQIEGKQTCSQTPAAPVSAPKENRDEWGNPFLYDSDGMKYQLLSVGHDWIEADSGQEVRSVEKER